MMVPVKSQNIGGRNIPAVGINNFNLRIDSSKIHIDLSGSIVAEIADAFISLFKGLILDKISGVVNNDVPSVIESVINSKLAGTNGLASLYKELSFDFTFSENPVITDNNLALYLNATLYNSTSGYRIP